ncbi:MAG: hypothetical protein MJ175_00700 [Clostridia bacterium]|nr:hypothetical protein [Clostridia bacterium]
MNYQATEEDIRKLEQSYEGRKPYHGEMHDHSASGGTSDGACALSVWKEELAALKMDFAAILDHRQVRHMYLPEWDNTIFLCGSEPGTVITDSRASSKELHYNILVPTPKELEAFLADLPEYQFTGGPEGHFTYPFFTMERFGEIIDAVKAHGGMVVIPHPKQILVSDDPMDYWFRDETGLEAFYIGLDTQDTKDDTALWLELLHRGKRIWACAGCDKHNHPQDTALTTVYAPEKYNTVIFSVLRGGDFTCGPVGIRMLCGETLTGGHCSFTGKRLTFSVGDFHDSVKMDGHCYRVDFYDDKGLIFSSPVSPDETQYFALDADGDAAFYRAEVWDETRNLRIALGNPIWNDK